MDHINVIYDPSFNSLPNKISDVTKLKAFADDKLNVARMMISILDRVENWLPAFSSFPTVFSKAFSLKVGIVW